MVSPVFAYLIKTRGIQELLLPVNALTILHGQTCGCCRTEQEEQKQETPNTHPALLPSFCTGATKGGLFSGSCVEFSAKLTGSFYALFTEFQADPAVQLAKIHSHLLSKQPRNSCSMCTSVWDTTFSPFPRWTQTHLRVMAGWRTSKTRFANEWPCCALLLNSESLWQLSELVLAQGLQWESAAVLCVNKLCGLQDSQSQGWTPSIKQRASRAECNPRVCCTPHISGFGTLSPFGFVSAFSPKVRKYKISDCTGEVM